jgi:hypothetical protein
VLVNDRMILLRLRKCATTQVAAIVKIVVGGTFRKSVELGGGRPTSHGRLDIPVEGRRVVGTIRDPWSWYVSLWAYGCAGRGGLHKRVTRDRSARSVLGAAWREARSRRRLPREVLAGFRVGKHGSTDWSGLYADVDDVAAFRAWLELVLDPGQAPLVDPCYAGSGLPDVVGLLTWRYLALFSRDAEPLLRPGLLRSADEVRSFDATQNVCDDLVRTDRIAEEMPRLLARAGYVLDDDQQARLAELTHQDARRNVSSHRSWLEYYDPSTIALVAARDRLIVERHGFTVPRADR